MGQSENNKDAQLYIPYRWDCPYCHTANYEKDNEVGESSCDCCGGVVNLTS